MDKPASKTYSPEPPHPHLDQGHDDNQSHSHHQGHDHYHSHDRGHDHSHSHDRDHNHNHGHNHSHTHGAIDPNIASSELGIWAVQWSFVGLLVTTIAQAIVFGLSGSVALLADLIHNVGDTATAIPLGVAFLMARWKPTPRFSYGYGRTEDLAGVAIVGLVFFSALLTAYESVERFLHPQPLSHLSAICVAGLIGFVGNEAVAWFRIRVGQEISSAALIADGYHARADGLVSLAVILSALGSALGYIWADPAIGLLITGVLLKIVWESGQTIFTRLLDGVEPEVTETIAHTVDHVAAVKQVDRLQARWLGHRLYVELAIAVEPELSVLEGAAIAAAVEAELNSHIPYLAKVRVQVQPMVAKMVAKMVANKG